MVSNYFAWELVYSLDHHLPVNFLFNIRKNNCKSIDILGVLYDVTGNWEQSFYQAAVWTVLSGIFVAFIPYSRNKKMIGEGLVEKEIEESNNQWIPIILLVLAATVLLALVTYLTVISFS